MKHSQIEGNFLSPLSMSYAKRSKIAQSGDPETKKNQIRAFSKIQSNADIFKHSVIQMGEFSSMSFYYTVREENRQFNHKIIMFKQHEIIKLATKQVKHDTFMIHMLPFTLDCIGLLIALSGQSLLVSLAEEM